MAFWERGQEALIRATLFIPSPHLFSLRALHLCHAQEYLMGPGVGLIDGCRWYPALLAGVPCSTGRFYPLALCTMNPSVPASLSESPPEEPMSGACQPAELPSTRQSKGSKIQSVCFKSGAEWVRSGLIYAANGHGECQALNSLSGM